MIDMNILTLDDINKLIQIVEFYKVHSSDATHKLQLTEKLESIRKELLNIQYNKHLPMNAVVGVKILTKKDNISKDEKAVYKRK